MTGRSVLLVCRFTLIFSALCPGPARGGMPNPGPSAPSSPLQRPFDQLIEEICPGIPFLGRFPTAGRDTQNVREAVTVAMLEPALRDAFVPSHKGDGGEAKSRFLQGDSVRLLFLFDEDESFATCSAAAAQCSESPTAGLTLASNAAGFFVAFPGLKHACESGPMRCAVIELVRDLRVASDENLLPAATAYGPYLLESPGPGVFPSALGSLQAGAGYGLGVYIFEPSGRLVWFAPARVLADAARDLALVAGTLVASDRARRAGPGEPPRAAPSNPPRGTTAKRIKGRADRGSGPIDSATSAGTQEREGGESAELAPEAGKRPLLQELSFRVSAARGGSDPIPFSQSLAVRERHQRAVVLCFWGTWCQHCVEDAEFEALRTLDREYRQSVRLVGVAWEIVKSDQATRVWNLTSSKGLDFPQYIIPAEKPPQAVSNLTGGSGFPSFVVFDQGGRYLGAVVGPVSRTENLTALKKLIREATAPPQERRRTLTLGEGPEGRRHPYPWLGGRPQDDPSRLVPNGSD